MQAGALPWLRQLPARFQEEYKGLAVGAGLSLQRVAEWVYLERYLAHRCSGALLRVDGHIWIARNNDTFAPELWGYATLRSVTGRLPTLTFGLEGDLFTPTGVNRERLWLHYNYWAVDDAPAPGQPQLPAYAFLTEALETCATLSDVETLLDQIQRDDGMLLFAVDGKRESGALYECSCRSHRRRNLETSWLAATNHGTGELPSPEEEVTPLNSWSRLRHLEAQLVTLCGQSEGLTLPADLIHVLADANIERRGEEFSTAYANVACPGLGRLWYTFGGHPAASGGNWQRIPWPW